MRQLVLRPEIVRGQRIIPCPPNTCSSPVALKRRCDGEHQAYCSATHQGPPPGSTDARPVIAARRRSRDLVPAPGSRRSAEGFGRPAAPGQARFASFGRLQQHAAHSSNRAKPPGLDQSDPPGQRPHVDLIAEKDTWDCRLPAPHGITPPIATEALYRLSSRWPPRHSPIRRVPLCGETFDLRSPPAARATSTIAPSRLCLDRFHHARHAEISQLQADGVQVRPPRCARHHRPPMRLHVMKPGRGVSRRRRRPGDR